MHDVSTGEWEQVWLPLYPLASDDLLTGVYRMERGAALQRRYIEANPHTLSNLLVIDVDHPDAALRALGTRPMPNAVVENRTNGHCHAVWALQEPVTRTEYARRKPLAYAAAVTEGLRRAVDGDQGYSGLLTKNPIHDDWDTYWIGGELHSLSELAAKIDTMPPLRWRETRRYRENVAGLGRNCTLFETARTWAYREIHRHWGDPVGLSVAIQREAVELNTSFAVPLPSAEVRSIASSITRWILTKSRLWADGPAVYEATFTLIQSARARKKKAAHAERRMEMLCDLEGSGND